MGTVVDITTDAGETWVREQAPHHGVLYDIVFADSETAITAGAGGQILRRRGPLSAVEYRAPEITASRSSITSIRPEPGERRAEIRLHVAERNEIAVEILDARGMVVTQPFHGILEPGEHLVPADLSGLPSGLYFCRLKGGQRTLGGEAGVAIQAFTIVR